MYTKGPSRIGQETIRGAKALLLLVLLAPPLCAEERQHSTLTRRTTADASPRIGIKTDARGFTGFYDKASGAAFTPRGNNFIRLRTISPGVLEHSTFDPGQYSASAVGAALDKMHVLQYNIVRVFLNYATIGGALSGPGVDPTYILNVCDLLSQARSRSIYVILTPDGSLPSNYLSIQGAPSPDVDNVNRMVLDVGFIRAYATYVADLLWAIRNVSPSLLSTIFSVDIRNESYVTGQYKPFALTTGTVTLGDGGTYDMASAASRQLAADNNGRNSVDRVAASIRSVDPEILVTASVYTPLQVGRLGYDGIQPNVDPRAPIRVKALESSQIDYVDLHPYPQGTGRQLSDELASAEVGPAQAGAKPRVIGEFGALKAVYPDLPNASRALLDAQIESCVAYGFKGWLLWTWDAPDPEQGRFWSAVDGLNDTLAPTARPDACSRAIAQPPAQWSWILAAAAHASGAGGAFYTTDLTVSNQGTSDTTFAIQFLGHDTDGRVAPQIPFALGAGKAVVYRDVLASLFGVTSGYGAVRTVSSSRDLRLMSQTSTPSSLGGTFGQAVPIAGPDDLVAAGSQKWILGIREDGDFRTNLILTNATEQPVDVEVGLVSDTGILLASHLYQLQPLGMTQVSRVVRDLGVSVDLANARLVVSTPTPLAVFAAYASVIDNVTNDPRTLIPK